MAQFNENEHPRAEDGKFTSKEGGSTTSSTKSESKMSEDELDEVGFQVGNWLGDEFQEATGMLDEDIPLFKNKFPKYDDFVDFVAKGNNITPEQAKQVLEYEGIVWEDKPSASERLGVKMAEPSTQVKAESPSGLAKRMESERPYQNKANDLRDAQLFSSIGHGTLKLGENIYSKAFEGRPTPMNSKKMRHMKVGTDISRNNAKYKKHQSTPMTNIDKK